LLPLLSEAKRGEYYRRGKSIIHSVYLKIYKIDRERDMDYFFTFEKDLPENVGFDLYSSGHIAWLLAVAFVGVIAPLLYARAGKVGRKRADVIIGTVMLLLELLWNSVLFAGGNLKSDMLPLHLCAISVFMYVIYAYTGVKWIGEYIYCLGIPGAVCALLFPDWNMYPFGSYYCISSFLLHGLLVVYGIMLLASGRVKPRIKNLSRPMGFLLCCAAAVYIFNRRYGTNYMFLMTPSEGSPLIFISNIFSQKLYLLGFFLLVVAVELMLYLPWELWAARKSKKTA
jgi:hypothetical integral membrane protein (TIGR02206 family)